jgi:hypothetical protein
LRFCPPSWQLGKHLARSPHPNLATGTIDPDVLRWHMGVVAALDVYVELPDLHAGGVNQ